MSHNDSPASPNAHAATDPDLAIRRAKAVRNISHGVYLQIFLGVGLLIVSVMGFTLGPIFDGPKAYGVILIGLAINSLIYINHYKRLAT